MKENEYKELLEYFSGDELATDVWLKKYSLKDSNGNIIEKSPCEMHLRMANEFARIEEKYSNNIDYNNLSEYGKKRNKLDKNKIFEYFDKFKYIIPQGSVMANLGNPYNYSSLSNCIVLPEIYDSYGGICFADQQLVQLMKRRCVEENSYVSTNRGILKIKDVRIGDKILSYNIDNKKSEFRIIKDKFITNVEPYDRVKITFSNGTILKTSLKHPILTLKDEYNYINTNELKIGNICIKPEKLDIDYTQDIENFDLNKDISWFIGAHIGDGTCGRVKTSKKNGNKKYIYNRLRFRILGDNENVVKRYCEILNKITNSNILYKKSNIKYYKSVVWEYHNISKPLFEVCEKYLDNQIGKKVYNAKIPNFIINNNLWIPFISGLIDTDGWIKPSKSISIGICAKNIIDQLSSYLSSLGISYSVFKRIYYNGYKPIYNLTIHASNLQFVNELKKYMVHEIKLSKLDNLDDYRFFSRKLYLTEKERVDIINNYGLLSNKQNNLVKLISLLKKDKNSGIGLLRELVNNNLINLEKYLEINQRIFIEKIELDKDSENYIDLEVEDNNNFYTGNFGMINIHNCGVGLDLSTLRPKDAMVKNSAGTSTGAVSFMERFSNTTREVAQSGRRGALMLTLSIDHPDIEYFITIKQDLKKVTGANISVKISDDFMNCVKEDKDFELKFPIGSGNPIFKRTVKARYLWNKIIESARNTAEPGVIFWDRHNNYSTSSLYPQYKNISTNPCVVGDTLLLTNKGWLRIKNLERYKKDIKIITRDKNGVLYNSELKDIIITKNEDLYKVLIDNGDFLLVNQDHKFYDIDFNEIGLKNLKGVEVVSGNGMVKVIDVVKIDKKENVYDIKAYPNYNYFCILNREELIIEDKIIINDNVRLNYFDIVNSLGIQKFAYELEEGDDINL